MYQCVKEYLAYSSARVRIALHAHLIFVANARFEILEIKGMNDIVRKADERALHLIVIEKIRAIAKTPYFDIEAGAKFVRFRVEKQSRSSGILVYRHSYESGFPTDYQLF